MEGENKELMDKVHSEELAAAAEGLISAVEEDSQQQVSSQQAGLEAIDMSELADLGGIINEGADQVTVEKEDLAVKAIYKILIEDAKEREDEPDSVMDFDDFTEKLDPTKQVAQVLSDQGITKDGIGKILEAVNEKAVAENSAHNNSMRLEGHLDTTTKGLADDLNVKSLSEALDAINTQKEGQTVGIS